MILALVLGGMLSAKAQHVQESNFCSPFDFPILLSANFGELRPNHFHNGLDIKTQGVTGKPIHCIADGYVSRVAVLHGGYGQAIYVTHPNGLTSVYGHVISFAKNIQACVRQYQYAHETFVCDLKFQPGQFPVKKGDIIALSGNEGASAGPHLHLELRRTETGEYIDPMPYFKHLLKDSKAPVGTLIGIYPIQGKGVVNGSSHKKLLAIGNLKQPVHAWGEIYTGISAKDYMDGTSNFYGVHSVTLYVDSVQVFNSTTDKVLPDENRMINGFTDYEELTRTRRLIMRSYKLPGNRLRLLHTNENRGAVTIDEERDYHFRYVLEDNFGNRRTYQFIVKGKRQDIPEYKPEANEMLYWNRTNVIQKPGMELVVPRYYVYEDVPLPTKYYNVQKAGKWRISMGGKYANGLIKTRVRSLGTFSVDVDTIAPQITPIGQGGWRTSRNIRFRIKDMESGIGSYKVYIDGKFVLFGLKKGILVIQDPEKVKKGVPHKLEVTVTDQCGNMARKEYKF